MHNQNHPPSSTVDPVLTARDLLKQLREQFPVFRDYLPLAIGIDKQILSTLPELDRKTLRIALGLHTNSTRYQKGMMHADLRHHLDGNAAEEVSEAHRARATEILRERFKKEAERRKAEQQEAQRQQQRAEKLSQLTAKFSRHKQ